MSSSGWQHDHAWLFNGVHFCVTCLMFSMHCMAPNTVLCLSANAMSTTCSAQAAQKEQTSPLTFQRSSICQSASCPLSCRYKCVIILCDSQWCDPDLDSSNGIQMGLRDMLRIDSMLMMVQLNIRVLLEVGLPQPSLHTLALQCQLAPAGGEGCCCVLSALCQQQAHRQAAHSRP